MRQHGVAEKKTRLGIITLTFMILLCHQLSPQPGHTVFSILLICKLEMTLLIMKWLQDSINEKIYEDQV